MGLPEFAFAFTLLRAAEPTTLHPRMRLAEGASASSVTKMPFVAAALHGK
jgi:hypothetical protein